jgi:hypothetical protein
MSSHRWESAKRSGTASTTKAGPGRQRSRVRVHRTDRPTVQGHRGNGGVPLDQGARPGSAPGSQGIDKSGIYFTEWVTTKPNSNGHRNGHTRESDHNGRIPPGQGHDTMVSYCGVLLQKYPDIELTEYVERCRARWEEFDQSKFRWTWQECLKNPVMDCWYHFDRGEPYVPPEPRDFTFTPPGPEDETEEEWSRLVDLGPYLDGTIQRPQPAVGALRDDDIQLLYPKRWHTVIGLTTAGKTTFALWHIKAVLETGGHVAYLHFEESEPGGVLDRLDGIGVDKETIRKQFHWFSCEKKWTPGEMAYRIGQLEQPPDLAVLDGINAACSQHGWEHGDPSAIGEYRAMFVTPLAIAGAAILSLGHPPKAKNRQNEMHGFGSTAWLDEVDGVGFRMVASKHPMEIGKRGWSELYLVKDRYSRVKQQGNVDTSKTQPWY